MNKRWKNRGVIFLLALCLVASTLCLVVDDRLVVTLLESVKAINLAGQARSDLQTSREELATLSLEVEQRRLQLEHQASRSYPIIEEVKALQANHRLRLVQMERVTGEMQAGAGLLSYNTLFTGTLGGCVRFLKELEEKHIVHSETVSLRPANEDGSLVALSLTLQVREQ